MSATTKGLDYKLSLNVPFEAERQAHIAKESLSPDPILKSDSLEVELEVSGKSLVCHFSGKSDRNIRVSINNIIENLKTVIECMDEFEDKEDVLFQKS